MNESLRQVFLSVVIPVHNEAENIANTCTAVTEEFRRNDIGDYEILVVNDNSTDDTEAILKALAEQDARVRYLNNAASMGFGFAVRTGLEHFKGEAVAVMMGDLSDSPQDLVTYYQKLKEGWECVFGSRFMRGAELQDYPWVKLILNRLANWCIKTLFRVDHNDITNAFKAYRRNVINGVRPILSHHFNLTVELPLKAMVRGYRWVKVPVSWTNRTRGVSKLRIKEMGSRYLFIVFYVLLEKWLSKGDYVRSDR